MSIALAVRDRADGHWDNFTQGPVTLGERAALRVTLRPENPCGGVRLLVGDVPVSSTAWEDRTESRPRGFGFPPYEWVCVGKFLRDWVGETELTAEYLDGLDWKPLGTLGPILVQPERLRPEEFAALCDAVAEQSADLLTDIYGKTRLGRPGFNDRSSIGSLARLRQVLDQLAAALGEIARQPAYRLRTVRVREPALPGQAIGSLTLDEALVDPSLVGRRGGRVIFREQVREKASPHFALAENQLLADFLAFLRQQLGDLRSSLRSEVAWREAQRAVRDRPNPSGGLSWWESEDLPRIEEGSRLLRQCEGLEQEINRLARLPFLPPGEALSELPPSTPLVRSHRAYGSAYRVVAEHFAGHSLRLDAQHLVTRSRSVPVLYEWWCALDVLRVLRSLLAPVGVDVGRRLASDPGRYVVDFTSDQSLEFRDDVGRRVHFRYQPAYRPAGEDRPYGLLGRGAMRTPDLAIEIFPIGDSLVPELIIVLDAKYTSAPHLAKLDELKLKYDRIGEYRTGRVLSRQVWALVPTPARAPISTPAWAADCTVDNAAVIHAEFDIRSFATGVLHAAPLTGPGKPPLDGLLRHLFLRAGVQVCGDEAAAAGEGI